MKALFLIVSALNCSCAFSLEPIASSTPLDSVLDTWPRSYLEYVEGRQRISMCTGVIWLGNNRLASIGAYSHTFDSYQFDAEIPSLTAYRAENLNALQETRIVQLENLAINPDGSLIAVADNGLSAIHLYQVVGDQIQHAAEIPKKGWWNHGVRFSRQMDYLAYTVFGTPGMIRLFRLNQTDGGVELRSLQDLKAPLAPLHPKAIDFSPDGRFVVICQAHNNTKVPRPVSGALTVHAFDAIKGFIDPAPLCVLEDAELIRIPEDLCFTPDGTAILVTNHASDTVTIHAFNPETGEIGASRIFLQNPEAQLFFPHGLNISPDGKYLAVTNYGDDTVKIYKIGGAALQ